jgi:hypothetical protein
VFFSSVGAFITSIVPLPFLLIEIVPELRGMGCDSAPPANVRSVTISYRPSSPFAVHHSNDKNPGKEH